MENKKTNSNIGLAQGGILGLVGKAAKFGFAIILSLQLMSFLQLADRYVLLQEAQAGYPAAKAMLEQTQSKRMELSKESQAK